MLHNLQRGQGLVSYALILVLAVVVVIVLTLVIASVFDVALWWVCAGWGALYALLTVGTWLRGLLRRKR